MTFDITRFHKAWFQEVETLKISKILSEMWPCFRICGRIQKMGWTQLASTSKIILVDVENSLFGYLGHSSCGWEGVRSTLLTWGHTWTWTLGHLDTWTLTLGHFTWARGYLNTWTLGNVDTWTLGHLDTWRTLGQLETCENTRSPPEIIKKSMLLKMDQIP